MLELMKYVLRDKDEADITMTAFRKQIAHKSTRIGVVQKFILYEWTRLNPRLFKIHWHSFVIRDVQI